MPAELLREIRKLEVRINDFLESEKTCIESMRRYVDRLKEFNQAVDEAEANPTPERSGKALRLKAEAAQALGEILQKMGELDHERSHLLESLGALARALEESAQKLLSQG